MLSTNFQESQRIENQLKGRAGRQVHIRQHDMLSAVPAHSHAMHSRHATASCSHLTA